MNSMEYWDYTVELECIQGHSPTSGTVMLTWCQTPESDIDSQRTKVITRSEDLLDPKAILYKESMYNNLKRQFFEKKRI